MDKIAVLVNFWMSHLVVLTECIFAAILAISIIWLFVNLKGESDPQGGSNIKDIEDAMKRVLRDTSTPMTTAADIANLIEDEDHLPPTGNTMKTMAAVTPPAGPAKDAEEKNKKLQELEKALTSANEELKKAQESLKNKPTAETETITVELKKKVSTLEARLGEYAIIEDDIANLNLYKEENTRLKNEIEKLRSPSVVAAIPEVPSTEVKTEVPVAPSQPETKTVAPPPPVAAAAPEPAPALAAAPEVAAAPTPATPTAETPAATPTVDAEKLVQEFDALMKSPPPEVKDSGKDSGEKLVEEFENFMKEGKPT